MFTDLRIGRRVARRFAPIVLAAVMLVPSGAAAGEATTRLFGDTVGRFGPSGVMVFAGGARRWSREDEPSLMAHGR